MSWCHWAFELVQLLVFITLWVFWVAAALWTCSPRTRWIKLHETWIACYGFFQKGSKARNVKKLPEPAEILTLECRVPKPRCTFPPEPKDLEMEMDSVASSLSSSSLGSLTSISSNWSLSSTSDDVTSLPGTPLTSSPSAAEEDGRYSPLLHRPHGAGLEELHRDPMSLQPVQFNNCRKVLQELWGETIPHWESLGELIPGAPNLQQASEITSETDFGSIWSRRSREEALSKWERHQSLSDQEEVQRSSSWEMFAVVPRPSSCPNCNPQTSRVPSGHLLTLPASNGIQDRLSPSGNTKETLVKTTVQLLEEMMSEKAISLEERSALPKHPSRRGQLHHRRPCTALDSDATQHLDFNVKKKQIPELWGEPTPSTKSVDQLTCQAPLSPSPVHSLSPAKRAEKERSRQSGPMTIKPSSVKTRAQLLEAMMSRGGTFWKEKSALPKPHLHKAHHAPRGPCTAISSDTTQHLEFNMKKKQMQGLWGEPTPLAESLTQLGCHTSHSPSPVPSCSSPLRPKEEEEELSEPTRGPSVGFASLTMRACSPQPILFTSSQKESAVRVAPKKKPEGGNEFRVVKRVTLPPTRPGFSESSLRGRFVSRGRSRRPRSSRPTSKSSPGILSAPEKKVKGRAASLESKEAQSHQAGTESYRQPSKSIKKGQAISQQGASHQKEHRISPKENVPVAKPSCAQPALRVTPHLDPKQDSLQQLEIRLAGEMVVPAKESAHQFSSGEGLQLAPHFSSKKEIEFSEKMKAPMREYAPQPSIEEGPQPAPHFSSKKEIELSEQMKAPRGESAPQSSVEECHQPPPLPLSSSVQHTLESRAGRGRERESLAHKAEDRPCSSRSDTPMGNIGKSLATGGEPHSPIESTSHSGTLENQSKGAPFHVMGSAESPWEGESCLAGRENTLDEMHRRKGMSHEDPPEMMGHTVSLEDNLPKEPTASAPGQMPIPKDPGHKCQGDLPQDGEGGPPVAKPLLSSEKGSRTLEQTKSSSQRPAPQISGEEVPYATLTISEGCESTARATLKPEAREGRQLRPATKLPASPLPTSQVASSKAVLHFQGNSSGTTMSKLPPSPQAPPELPSRQQLSRSILASLSVEQTVEDLRLSLAQGLEMGHGELRAEYPVCRQCGSCSAMCPHPRTQQDPLLHIFPRLTVRNGNVLMGLDFHLKINKIHARKWGLPETAEEGKGQEQAPERGGSSGIKDSIPANPGPRAPCKPSGVMVQHVQMGTQFEATSSSVQVSLGKKPAGKGKCLPPPSLERQLQQGPPQAGHHLGRGPKEVPTAEKPSRNPVKRMLHVIKQAWTRIRGNKEKLVHPPEKRPIAGTRGRLGTPPVKDSSQKRSTRSTQATSANPKALGSLGTQAAAAAAAPAGKVPPICRVRPTSSGSVKRSFPGLPPGPSRQPSSQLGVSSRKGTTSKKPGTPAFGAPQKSGFIVSPKPSSVPTMNGGMATMKQVVPPAPFKSNSETRKLHPKKESPGTTREAGGPLPKRAPAKKVWFLASK